MKIFKTTIIILTTLIIQACGQVENSAIEIAEAENPTADREYYQLKVYSLESEEQENSVDQFLQEAYIPALHRININNIGVFKTVPNETDTIKKLYVLIPFESLPQFEEIESILMQDKEYLDIGSTYINASYEEPPYNRVESMLLKAFVDMPQMKTPSLKGPKSNRVYELRSYESATEKIYVNKVDMFNAGGEIALFEKLNFNAVFFSEVLAGARMPNLVYMTTFENMESRDTHWKSFVDSEEWKTLSAMPKYQNNVSHADIWLLQPTDYSDF